MKNITWTIILCTFLSQSLFSQQDLSLEQAIQTALSGNFDVSVSTRQLSQAQIYKHPGAAGMLPTVTANAANVNRFDKNQQGAYSTHSVLPGAQLSYRIFGGYSARVNLERLGLLEDISEGNVDLVLENTIQAVILAYNQVLVEQEKKEVFARILELSRDRYRYEVNRQELGLSVSFEVLQASNAYLNDSSHFLLQELSHKNALRNLNLIMNQDLDREYSFTDDLSVPEERLDREGVIQAILNNSTALRRQSLNLDLSQKQIRLQKSALFPTLDFRAGGDYGWGRIKFDGQDAVSGTSFDYYANFTLSYTLFNGGNVRRAIRDATLDYQINELQTASLQQNILNQGLALSDMYVVQLNQLSLAAEQLKAAALNMDIAAERFRNGSISSFNYRDIQLSYLNAALNQISVKYQVVASHTQLLRLRGLLLQQE